MISAFSRIFSFNLSLERRGTQNVFLGGGGSLDFYDGRRGISDKRKRNTHTDLVHGGRLFDTSKKVTLQHLGWLTFGMSTDISHRAHSRRTAEDYRLYTANLATCSGHNLYTYNMRHFKMKSSI